MKVHTTYAGNDLIDGEVLVYIVMDGDQAVFASLNEAEADTWAMVRAVWATGEEEYDTERDHESYTADPEDLAHELSQDK
jgi:hypothetical protein